MNCEVFQGPRWTKSSKDKPDLGVDGSGLAIQNNNIHTLHGGHFCFRHPTFLEFPFQGVLFIRM